MPLGKFNYRFALIMIKTAVEAAVCKAQIAMIMTRIIGANAQPALIMIMMAGIRIATGM